MPSLEEVRGRLLRKLSELFQLNQPDLDFGFYRIMHAKAHEVQSFIDKDLLKIVTDAFGEQAQASNQEQLETARKKVIATLGEAAIDSAGVLNSVFEQTPAGKDYLETIKKISLQKDNASAEADIYDHLFRFFERYYEDGDFISRRYYTRETSGKAAPFAVPYNGEEVKLHWANADQYYIKSTEYFSNFTFDLRQAKEIRALEQQNQIDLPFGAGAEPPLKAHFRVVEASEGEHGNVKASEANKRYFILHTENPVALAEHGELIVNFEYRPDPEKTGKETPWRDKRNTEAVKTILERLQTMAAAGGEHEKRVAEYLRLFKVLSPTDSDEKRPLLAKYVNQYTARNTMDYFIHKDLGGFLRRELDFYIKNEVMRLDDIENADAPAVESYLSKIKVLRKIAGKLIDFLAQLEDFQKKLWLKKKFIIETNYCITLDRVPEELYAEVASNEAQLEEWIKLFAIDEIQGDLLIPGFSRHMTKEFLKANNKLVLDTRFFDENFKARLVASIENFDEQCDGLLIHSENFQALNLLQERYREQVKCVYIDPPYNTDNDGFPYKDSYKSSSWLSMIQAPISLVETLTKKDDAFFAMSIDKRQLFEGKSLLDSSFKKFSFINAIVNVNNPKGRSDQKHLPTAHDNILLFATDGAVSHGWKPANKVLKRYRKQDEEGQYREMDLRKTGDNDLAKDRPKMAYPFAYNKTTFDLYPLSDSEKCPNGYFLIYPMKDAQTKGRWRWELNTSKRNLTRLIAKYQPQKSQWSVFEKDYLGDDERVFPTSVWDEKPFNSERGTETLSDLGFEKEEFSRPKPVGLMSHLVEHLNRDGVFTFDYFAGSGTTGHAVINLNREEDTKRKYILVEMGNCFDTVLKPRISKVVYSENWKDGKPMARGTGISHCFKYIRLESYEDTLNNLRFDDNPNRTKALAANPTLNEDFMLHYLLDVETRGSQSLLNIDDFADPTAYTLQVKKPGTDEYVTRTVDLIETFNYLIGLRVEHTSVSQTFHATFKRIADQELSEDQHTKLVVDGRIRQNDGGPWWFRKIEGWVPEDPANPNNGQREKVLIVWRKLTGDIEQDNLMLDEWFEKNRISTRDFEFDTIYVNGSNNLPNLKLEDENWKVRLIEEEFKKRMWNGETV